MLEAPSISQNELCSAGKSDTSAELVVSTECLCASSEYTVPAYKSQPACQQMYHAKTTCRSKQ